MTNCANCTAAAIYEYKVTDSYKQFYCPEHLPKFLKGKTSESMLVSIVKPEAPAKKKKAAPPPAEETPEEE
jgi:hypothetical protein